MIEENNSLLAAYKEHTDTNKNRRAIRIALTAMSFEEIIDFVLFSAQTGFKDGVEATLKELEDKG